MQIIATGKNVEIAIQNGLLECGLTRDEVQVRVIDQGGLFKKAKVELTWGETASKLDEPAEQENIAEQPAKEVAEEQAEVETAPVKERVRRVVDTARLQQACTEFLTGLTHFVDESATVECTAGENELSFSVKGEKLGKFIGFHGDNLKAIQLLLSGLKRKSEGAVRIYLDIDGYKASREQTLIDLANKTAEQAVNIGHNIHLDPMSAYDRRIIHTTIQGRTDVTTESTGEGEKRHVVVKPIFKK